jgi:hypothetical protein
MTLLHSVVVLAVWAAVAAVGGMWLFSRRDVTE